MKKLKLVIVATVAALFLGMSNVNAQEHQTVIIKMYEQNIVYRRNISKIYITNPSGKTQSIDIDGYSETGMEVENNTLKLHDEITKWQKEGFILKEFLLTFSPTPITRITTVILTK